jgi:hypothetical protein
MSVWKYIFSYGYSYGDTRETNQERPNITRENGRVPSGCQAREPSTRPTASGLSRRTLEPAMRRTGRLLRVAGDRPLRAGHVALFP